DEELWLDGGHAMEHGDPKRVVDAYLTKVERDEGVQLAETTARAVEDASRHEQSRPSTGAANASGPPGEQVSQPTEGRWGSREVEILDVALLDRQQAQSFVFQSGEPVSIRLKVRAHKPTNDFVFGIGIFNAEGVCCY